MAETSRPAIKSKYFTERVHRKDINLTQEIKCSIHYCLLPPIRRARAQQHIYETLMHICAASEQMKSQT